MIKRLSIYLNEMFPVTAVMGTLLTSFAVQLVYLRLSGLPAQFHIQMLLSGLYLTAMSLLVRVMDEFKDFEDDKKNFPHRPLPSGRVYKSDLLNLGFFCVGTILVVSLSSLKILGWSLFGLFYAFLMLKWFFIEARMRQSLPLAFLSHHPIVLINFVYLILGVSEAFSGVTWEHAPLILPLCIIFTNWELARKIRQPDQETNYTTYSKILGARFAISLSLIFQGIAIATVLAIFLKLQGPVFLRIVFSLLMALMVWPSMRFLFTLKLKAPLKLNAESQILIVIGFLMAAALL